ncbi:MAG: hypothetical protein LBK95_10875 [Bifidobacteriaceae bacterium]|nr:hypothetical protein [Bifidobacteriaceae bacterium]
MHYDARGAEPGGHPFVVRYYYDLGQSATVEYIPEVEAPGAEPGPTPGGATPGAVVPGASAAGNSPAGGSGRSSDGELPFTGASGSVLATAAVPLLAVGILATAWAARRRRMAHSRTAM